MTTFTRIIAGFLPLALASCSVSDPTHFYVLRSNRVSPDISGVSQNVEQMISLAPVEIPAYLGRDGIVTRVGETELRISDFNQWAEPLQDALRRRIREVISAEVRNSEAKVSSKPSGARGRTLVINVVRFERFQDTVAFWGFWRIKDEPDRRLFVVNEACEGPDYDHTVQCMASAVDNASRGIAGILMTLPPRVAGKGDRVDEE